MNQKLLSCTLEHIGYARRLFAAIREHTIDYPSLSLNESTGEVWVDDIDCVAAEETLSEFKSYVFGFHKCFLEYVPSTEEEVKEDEAAQTTTNDVTMNIKNGAYVHALHLVLADTSNPDYRNDIIVCCKLIVDDDNSGSGEEPVLTTEEYRIEFPPESEEAAYQRSKKLTAEEALKNDTLNNPDPFETV